MKKEHSWTEIYNYYMQHGLLSFIISNISNFVIGLIISFSPIFLFGCCDWSNISNSTKVTDFVHGISFGWHNSNIFVKLCTIIFFIFVSFNIAQFIFALPTYISLHKYYNNVLDIKDNDLYVIDWNEIIETIAQKDKTRSISLLEIAQEIMRFDNYIIAFATDPTILTWKLPYMDSMCHIPMSKSFIYLFKLSLNGTVLDSDGESLISDTQSIMIPKAEMSLKKRFNTIGILLFLLSPFVFCFEILYIIFHYFEAVKNCPGTLSYRRWATHAKWAIKEYNELPHVFNQRLSKSFYFANQFLDMFPPTALQPILKLIQFLCGSLIAIILLIGLVTDVSALVLVKFSGEKTIAWFCTLLASIYGISHSLIIDESTIQDPESLYERVKEYIHYDFTENTNSASSWRTYRNFSDFFQPLWKIIAVELGSCIINPILFLFVLPKKTNAIVEFIRNNSIQHQRLGWICSFSSFNEGSFAQNDFQCNKIKRSISNFRLSTNFVTPQELLGFNDDFLQEMPLVTRVPSPSFINEGFNK